jgi:hypothetical protein
MITKLITLYFGGVLAVAAFLAQPMLADDWNKRMEFQFSASVEIPGKVLAPGKYVFELANSQSDRNIVQVFSENSDGNDTLVATLMAIPDYMTDTPDKPVVHFEERHSGSPEAIHSWFYPGDNTGWEFVYPKGQTLEANADTIPAPALVAAAPAPSLQPLPPAPQIQEAQSALDVALAEEEDLVAQNDLPAPPPAQRTDNPSTAERTLPQTGGHSDLGLLLGLVMLSVGIAAVRNPVPPPTQKCLNRRTWQATACGAAIHASSPCCF